MPNDPQDTSPREPVLAPAEAARRLALLADLRASLTGEGLHCVLARTSRLVLREGNDVPYEPSGPTDPRLYILAADGNRIVTTDGAAYCVAGQLYPASDPPAAAERIARRAMPAPR